MSARPSALETVEARIARIEAVNPVLNAVVWKRYAEARREARAADARRAAGEALGPLDGLPITVKDSIDLEGAPSTFGIPSRKGALATRDDRFVARLRRAGAVVLGKTNVAQLLLFVETDNPLHGRANNPWDRERTPGGSSGGEAAILAAGGSDLGLGTDIGGSSRVPPAFCGVVGFKATAGRLPDAGRWSVPIGEQAIVSQIGLMAREVSLVASALEIVNGGRDPEPDGLEPPRPLGDPRAVDVARLRVAWFDDDGVLRPSPALRRAVREAAGVLAEAGATVTEWRPPDVGEAVFLLYALLSADGGRGIGRALGHDARDPRIKQLETLAGLSGPARAALGAALRLTGRGKAAAALPAFGHTTTDAYWQLVERLLGYRERWSAALDDSKIDLVLSPPVGLAAVRHRATLELGLIGGYAALYNVLGYPAGVVPFTTVRAGEESDREASRDKLGRTAIECERGSARLPVGVQVAARPWRDHFALAAMAAIERAARQRAGFPVTPVTPA